MIEVTIYINKSFGAGIDKCKYSEDTDSLEFIDRHNKKNYQVYIIDISIWMWNSKRSSEDLIFFVREWINLWKINTGNVWDICCEEE